jgi:hypothetical protein
VAPRVPEAAPGSGLEEALALCEAGDWEGMRQLRSWSGGRLRTTLERMIGDDELAAQALEAALDDIWRHAGAHRAMGIDAADWVFGRLRLAAREFPSPTPPPAATKLRAVPGPATPPVDATPAPPPPRAPDPGRAPPAPRVPDDDDAPVLVNARIRRPTAPPVQPRRAVAPMAEHAAPPPARGGRPWLRALLLWLLAGALGFAAAVLALQWLYAEPPVRRAPEPSLPAPSADIASPAPSAEEALPPAPPADDVPPEPPAREVPPPSAREFLGQPLVAREPPVAAAPDEPLPSPAPPAPRAATTAPRIVVHHGADPESGGVAAQLAEQLRRAGLGGVEVRPVGFEIGAASVRYFHVGDRAAAERLVNALGPFLAWHGRAAPSTPIDFTDFRPLPRAGSLEIWLPRR